MRNMISGTLLGASLLAGSAQAQEVTREGLEQAVQANETELTEISDRHESLMAELEALRKKLASILGGLPVRIQPVDLPGMGTWYRLQAGAFERRDDAAALCDRLAQAGHDSCWVTSQP